MPRRYRESRLKTERDRIRAFIPRGSLNAVAIQLLLYYVGVLEAQGSRPQLPWKIDSSPTPARYLTTNTL